MAGHSSKFENEANLNYMGASWFVSYSYYLYINNQHTNWRKVRTCQSRICRFIKTEKDHRSFIKRIIEMNERRLDWNTFGLKGSEVIQMAKEIWQNKYAALK